MIKLLGDVFNLLLIQPLINYMVFLVRSLEWLRVPGVLGLSIIMLTLSVKLVLWRVSAKQIKEMKKSTETMNLLKPKLSELKKKHGQDKVAFAQAQSALFKEHGYSPAAGCLPNLILAVLIYPLYQIIQAFVDNAQGLSKINYFLYNKEWSLSHLPDPYFLGFNLSQKPSEFTTVGYLVLLVPLLTGVLQFFYSKMLTPKPVKPYPSDSKKEIMEKDENDDMSQAMQTQMQYMMPLMIAFFSWSFPIGLALYWNVLNIISMLQQYLVMGGSGFGGLLKGKEPVTKVKIERS